MNKYFALAALIFSVSPAYAGEVAEFQAASINLEPFQGIIYYTNANDGYHDAVAPLHGCQAERSIPLPHHSHEKGLQPRSRGHR